MARSLDGTPIAAAGWGLDIVLLVRATDFHILRTRPSGQIEIQSREEVLNAHRAYEHQVQHLAQQLRNNDDDEFDIPATSSGAMIRMVAYAWLTREAATTMLEQARYTLRTVMEGLERLETHQKDKSEAINLAELARNLHTDRANLYKLMPRTAAMRQRR